MNNKRCARSLLICACIALNHSAAGSEAAVGVEPVDHDDDYVYQLPYGTDIDYAVLQSYGSRFTHRGAEFYTVDFAMPEGSFVHAAREGVVIRVSESNSRGCLHEGCAKFANHVVIAHTDGTSGQYFHLQEEGVLVEEGQLVRRGEPIALSGNTGFTSSPHLHFGVYAPDLTEQPRSIEVRFATSVGLVTRLRVGRRYRNVEPDLFAHR